MISAGWLIPVGVLVLWILWYCAVLSPASRSAKDFGPQWLFCFCTRASRWFGECLCGVSLSCNVDGVVYESSMASDDEESCKQLEDHLNGQVLMLYHPHGAFMLTASLFGGTFFYPYNQTAKHKVHPCIASLLFRIPFLSELLLIQCCRTADKDNIVALLKEGRSVAVQPGGLYEQVKFDAAREVAYFPPGLGIFRLALQHGVPLVPVYIFGENQLYQQNSCTRAINGFMYKNFSIGTFCVFGRCGLPCPCVRPRDVYWHFGNHVEVGPAVENPTEEEVRDVFKRYVAELHNIFDTHAHEHLPAEVASQGLTIVWRDHEDEVL